MWKEKAIQQPLVLPGGPIARRWSAPQSAPQSAAIFEEQEVPSWYDAARAGRSATRRPLSCTMGFCHSYCSRGIMLVFEHLDSQPFPTGVLNGLLRILGANRKSNPRRPPHGVVWLGLVVTRVERRGEIAGGEGGGGVGGEAGTWARRRRLTRKRDAVMRAHAFGSGLCGACSPAACPARSRLVLLPQPPSFAYKRS
jgi:hypothetical protein